MRRRDLITLMGGIAAWPLAASAQPRDRMRRVGVLLPVFSSDAEYPILVATLVQALQQLGWVDGQNVRIYIRWAGGNFDATKKDAAELVALAPDVIIASGASSVDPLLQVTRTLPIVFTIVPDPVGARIRRQPRAARRKRHGLHELRIRHRRQVAGAAAGDRARGQAGGCAAGFQAPPLASVSGVPYRPQVRASDSM